jgi:UDP-GlcNAc3NAcA epimerase
MIKMLTIVGARPQFIKAAAISRTIPGQYGERIEEVLVHTGQHYDKGMSEVFFSELEIPAPRYNLGIGSGLHGYQTGAMLKELEEVLRIEKPDCLMVYGDTNSTLAAALAASKIFIPVIHVEAGLRSFNKSMPEEINRIYTDHVSTLLFAPTHTAIENLAREGIKTGNSEPFSIDHPGVFHSGDIMYDNTLYFRKKASELSDIIERSALEKGQYILVTIHRPSNTDSPPRLEAIFGGLLEIAEKKSISLVLPLHPRTAEKLKNHPDQNFIRRLSPENGIHIIPAVPYLDMVELEQHARIVITDSGGVQKEAYFMRKPVIVLRSETEWTEIIECGNGTLADADKNRLVEATEKYLANPPDTFPELFGNGNAAAEILDIVTKTSWK